MKKIANATIHSASPVAPASVDDRSWSAADVLTCRALFGDTVDGVDPTMAVADDEQRFAGAEEEDVLVGCDSGASRRLIQPRRHEAYSNLRDVCLAVGWSV